ncbi:MAG TPA: 3-deoxy-7-phosphoheptulonate synthase class II [Allosphingosinicella sp.]|jgi:3-deoxy-7-phosphoheptulonate synthase|nr:3-deoxy-7-phosphoheptulonate synthase class II [Allosphingosinicella sp.]
MIWTPDSWRAYDARQQPDYPDAGALAAATRELEAYPSLVRPREIDALRAMLAEAQAGRAFLLQGGDCAESFAEFSAANIAGTFGLIAAMARRLGAASGLPVIRLGRLAGQFAKPRSAALELQGGGALPAYRGDIVNQIGFEAAGRRPDPERMFRAYAQAAATLSHIETLAAADGSAFHTSHEALLLPFEQALVRRDADCGRFFAGSAHFLWVGQRTFFPGSAHVEFVRGLHNPIGIKCGPDLNPAILLDLLDRIDPLGQPGRITLISRMGHDRVKDLLPPLLAGVRAAGRPVLWACDPMHGNTLRTAAGTKTRPLEHILAELEGFFAATRAADVAGVGVHIEMTGRDVTECTGGGDMLTETDLADRYHSHCDPRLNPAQAMELAELVARELAGAPVPA